MILARSLDSERRIFTKRRNWKPVMIVLTLLAAVLFYSTVFAEVIHGVNKSGTYVCWYNTGPLLTFCYILTSERR